MSVATLAASHALDASPSPTGDEIDAFIENEMRTGRIPGLAAAVFKADRIVWSKGYGWADIANKRRMDPAHTVQNIGSVSKTITATAVMQMVEQQRLALDEDVSRYLPFPLRNPAHPSVPITCRLLLTHRSSIIDGPAYGKTYACGSPIAELGPWLKDYLAADGKLYEADKNFGSWEPGAKAQYSNIGFGLLGHLVERVSGESFRAYTSRRIFEPLGLPNTGWGWSEVDPKTLAVDYAPIGDPKDEELEQFRAFGLVEGKPEHHPTEGDFQPLCRYSFVTYPDGGLRTSVNQLARFVMAYLGGGKPILEPATVRTMLTEQTAQTGQGLAWRQSKAGTDLRWGHSGADPGIRTSMAFRPSDGVGVIVFSNRGHVEFDPIVDRLFLAAKRW